MKDWVIDYGVFFMIVFEMQIIDHEMVEMYGVLLF